MQSLTERIYGWLTQLFLSSIQNRLADQLQFCLGMATQACDGFWTSTYLASILSLVEWCCLLMWGIGAAMNLFDTMSSAAERGSIGYYRCVQSMVGGFAFAIAAPKMCKYMMILTSDLISTLDLNDVMAVDSFQNAVQNFAANLLNDLGGGIFFNLVCCIVCIYFFFCTAQRYGFMLIQSISCVLWQIPITRGDDTAFESWLRQTVAIAITYFCQYLVFWLSWWTLLRGEFVITICLWASLGGIPRLLDKWGLSVTGAGGNKLGLVMQAAYTLRSFTGH